MSISNTDRKELIPVDPTMLPLVAHALVIQRNYELMTGNKTAMRLTEELLRDVEGRMTPASKFFEPGSWAEIGHAIRATGRSFSIEIKVPDWKRWSVKGWIVVTVGEKSWKSSESEHASDGAEIGQIRDALEGIAPMEIQSA